MYMNSFSSRIFWNIYIQSVFVCVYVCVYVCVCVCVSEKIELQQ